MCACLPRWKEPHNASLWIIALFRRQRGGLSRYQHHSPLCLDLRHNDEFPNKDVSSLRFCSACRDKAAALQPHWGSVRVKTNATPTDRERLGAEGQSGFITTTFFLPTSNKHQKQSSHIILFWELWNDLLQEKKSRPEPFMKLNQLSSESVEVLRLLRSLQTPAMMTFLHIHCPHSSTFTLLFYI